MKNIAILGSTGSIGTQTLDVVRANGDLRVLGLGAEEILRNLRNRSENFIRCWRQYGMRRRRGTWRPGSGIRIPGWFRHGRTS